MKTSDDSKPNEELTVPLPVRIHRDTVHLEDTVQQSRGDASQSVGGVNFFFQHYVEQGTRQFF